jgi:hypothetical protein
MRDVGVWRGKSQKTSDWLVIPLHPHYHTGDEGIDKGSPRLTVPDWEQLYGRQVDHLDEVCRLLGVDVWELAGVRREV